MNKKLTLILLSSLLIQVAQAHIPTLDSLFRNGNNIDVEKKAIVANILIRKKVNQEQPAELTENEPNSFAFKFMTSSEIEGVNKFVQLEYRDGAFTPETINSLSVKDNFKFKDIESSPIDLKVFYSLLNSLLINDSQFMTSFLQQIDSNILKNKENVNEDQKKLLGQYKAYLVDVNNEVEGIVNPLKPEEPEQKENINKTLSGSLIQSSNLVKRVYKNKTFYLEYKTENIYALFDNDTHRLLTLRINSGESFLELELQNYVLYSQKFEFPELINMKLTNGESYEISLKKVFVLNDDFSSYMKRLKNYKKQLKEAENQVVTLIKPSFIM